MFKKTTKGKLISKIKWLYSSPFGWITGLYGLSSAIFAVLGFHSTDKTRGVVYLVIFFAVLFLIMLISVHTLVFEWLGVMFEHVKCNIKSIVKDALRENSEDILNNCVVDTVPLDVNDANFSEYGIFYEKREFSLTLDRVNKREEVYKVQQEAEFRVDRSIYSENEFPYTVCAHQHSLQGRPTQCISSKKDRFSDNSTMVDGPRVLMVRENKNHENHDHVEYLYNFYFRLPDKSVDTIEEYNISLNYTVNNKTDRSFIVKVIAPTKLLQFDFNFNGKHEFRNIDLSKISYDNWIMSKERKNQSIPQVYEKISAGRGRQSIIVKNPARGFVYILKYELMNVNLNARKGQRNRKVTKGHIQTVKLPKDTLPDP